MFDSGQKAKYSLRADVFRFAPNNGHRSNKWTNHRGSKSTFVRCCRKRTNPGVPDKPEIPDNGTFVGSRRSLMVAAHNGPGGTQMDVFATELYEVLPRASWSRRGFLGTTLATGFAVAP